MSLKINLIYFFLDDTFFNVEFFFHYIFLKFFIYLI